MDIQTLAAEAAVVIDDLRRNWDLRDDHGVEVAPGFFNIYNTFTGQSRVVLYHPESDFIFKTTYESDHHMASGSYIGGIDIDGIYYRVRLPEFYYINGIEAQEYVHGETHSCDSTRSSCEHSRAIAESTGYFDTHLGNWKIANGEIVYFDYN